MNHLTILKNWYYPFYFQSWKAAAKVSSRPYALAEDPDIVSVNVSRPNAYVPLDTTTTNGTSGGGGGIVVVCGQETAPLIMALFTWRPVILKMVHRASRPWKVPS
jgi:hypothetical protein